MDRDKANSLTNIREEAEGCRDSLITELQVFRLSQANFGCRMEGSRLREDERVQLLVSDMDEMKGRLEALEEEI